MVKYINSKNEEIDLTSEKIRIKTANLHEHIWSYDYKENKYGILIKRFKKAAAQYNLTLSFKGTETEKKEKLNRFFEMTEYDIANKTPGKLQYNDYYIECYVIGSNTTPGNYYDVEQTATILAPYPFWIMDKRFLFWGSSGTAKTSKNLNYPYDYPHDYAITGENDYIENDHYNSCDFELNVFGPATNPKILINGHIYEVITRLEQGEYLQVKSREGTIFKVSESGEKTSLYNYRNRDYSIFEKIPPGSSTVSWDGHFDFEITLYAERSIPKWIL